MSTIPGNDRSPISPDRLALARAFDMASSNGVGMSLGVWAGRGDWATCSQASRDEAGQDALAKLDELITNLNQYRQRLADAVAPTDQGGAPR